MYRDLIGDPERFTAGGKEWWLQQFCRMDGTLKAVRLYNADGEFVGDFDSMEAALQAAADGDLGKEGLNEHGERKVAAGNVATLSDVESLEMP